MKSEIVKLKNGPFHNAKFQIKTLKKQGWKCQVLSDDEIYMHGTQSCDFKHTYIWTVLCSK